MTWEQGEFLRKGDFSLQDFREFEPIVVSVVGPVNHGKTSVLRTLSEDDSFGEVRDGPATMRPEPKRYFFANREYLQLWDTPGFEISGEVLRRLEERSADDFALPEILEALQEIGADAKKDLRAWRQIEKSHVVLFTFDATVEPTDYRDDVRLLSRCGIPKIAIVNFTSYDATDTGVHTKRWVQMLRNWSIDTVVEYDAHDRNYDNEIELYNQIGFKLENGFGRQIMVQIIANRQAKEEGRKEEAAKTIATGLLEILSFQKTVSDVAERKRGEIEEALNSALLEEIVFRENDLHKQRVTIWGFPISILENKFDSGDPSLSKQANDWFGADVWKHFGIGAAAGAATGAAIGVVIDMFTGGMTLGTAALLGAGIGAALGSGAGTVFNSAYDEKSMTLTVTGGASRLAPTLTRAVDVVHQVRRRGKALDNRVSVEPAPPRIPDNLQTKIMDTLGDLGNPKKRNALKDEKLRAELVQQIIPTL